MDGGELAKLYGETKATADALPANAREIHELAQRLEALTKDTPAWYVGTRAKVAAGFAGVVSWTMPRTIRA
jgi:hypothetical protein